MKVQRPLEDDSPKSRGFPLEMLTGDSHGSPPLPCWGQVTDPNVPPTHRGSQGESGLSAEGGAPRLGGSNKTRMGRAAREER